MSYRDPRARPSLAELPAPGATVGGYLIERQIGHGGMAVVYEARHRSLGKRVALKMLLPPYAAGSEVARRFQREGEAAARIDHPHAVSVTDVGTDASGTPYLVMELLEGEDLASLLARVGRLTVEQAADILVPVASAIATAHELGIVHRDLKPQNIFLARRRHEIIPKVVDFGISKVLKESVRLTGTETLLGTPYYMSPEQSTGASRVDARSDQFSLGVIFYECITGHLPFTGNTLFAVLANILHGTPSPARSLVPGLVPAVEVILERTFQKEPGDRYPDMRTLGAALSELAGTRVRLAFAPEFGFPSDADPLQSATRPIQPERHEPPELARTRFMEDIRREPWHESASHDDALEDVAPPTRRAPPEVFFLSGAVLALAAALYWLTLADDDATRPESAAESDPPAVAEANTPAHRPPTPAPSAPKDTTPAAPVPPPVPSPTSPPAPPARAPTIDVTRPPTPVAASGNYEIDLTVEPTHAWIMLDGKSAGSGTLRRRMPIDGSEHTLIIGAPSYRAVSLKFKDAPPPPTVALTLRPMGLPSGAGARPEDTSAPPSAAETPPEQPTETPTIPTDPPAADPPSEPSIPGLPPQPYN